MEVFVDNSFKEGVDRAKEAAARRREEATRKFKGNSAAGREWLGAKNARRSQAVGR